MDNIIIYSLIGTIGFLIGQYVSSRNFLMNLFKHVESGKPIKYKHPAGVTISIYSLPAEIYFPAMTALAEKAARGEEIEGLDIKVAHDKPNS